VDPRASLDDVEKRKFLTLPGLGTPTPRSSSPEPVAIPTTLSQLLYIQRIKILPPMFEATSVFEGLIVLWDVLTGTNKRGTLYRWKLTSWLVIAVISLATAVLFSKNKLSEA
jgi:hypothetical protein